ncbi:tRNA (adenosine(37)-N6)-threonylcarbamoyltransferase complex dimerization subunit type 1 TsaB [Brevundimonas sp.]|uniref:tRNA (adenosine(37)-N6)-threonylcarbamoyltransferase complex dimerization subunit type 1 TsaB n=1 Tax=Brevundimonas sp. TaxID=1871086 RepID=UPI0022CBC7A6|nr:tRNA (adenosine(37)-N6)-threonylcarbamoyltransferase complex dimerization subunit type 1 TsaB [Brevundimonas sp.]MCZ8193368.1 tRNA (adenosine(37)-N6)-threonylcarbamoyltransferase complex dimerization subunit type 1 TsaB [Brevundimonas sp.]
MRGLVIDTALGGLSVALFEHGTILAARHELMARGHQERLGELVRDVAAEAGGFDGLGRITVTVGPGSFTGLRVGLAFALGLGAALDRPVLGITTLAALAGSVDSPGDASAGLPVLAAIDARRGEVYAQAFAGGRPSGAPEALTLEAALDLARTLGPAALVGSGAPLLAGACPAAAIQALAAPAPAGLVAAARRADQPARPLYLRAPDATPPSRLPGQPRPTREPS